MSKLGRTKKYPQKYLPAAFLDLEKRDDLGSIARVFSMGHSRWRTSTVFDILDTREGRRNLQLRMQLAVAAAPPLSNPEKGPYFDFSAKMGLMVLQAAFMASGTVILPNSAESSCEEMASAISDQRAWVGTL